MSSVIETKINRISQAVSSALAAVAAKGITVPEGAGVDALAGLIETIEGGGATIPAGFSELNGGYVTFATDTTNVSIAHGLSNKPKGFVFYREGAVSKNEFYLNYAYYYPFTFYNTSSGGSFPSVLIRSYGVSGSYQYTANKWANETNIIVNDGSFSYPCKANTVYRWLAWR